MFCSIKFVSLLVGGVSSTILLGYATTAHGQKPQHVFFVLVCFFLSTNTLKNITVLDGFDEIETNDITSSGNTSSGDFITSKIWFKVLYSMQIFKDCHIQYIHQKHWVSNLCVFVSQFCAQVKRYLFTPIT